jgi:hypothetical protein
MILSTIRADRAAVAECISHDRLRHSQPLSKKLVAIVLHRTLRPPASYAERTSRDPYRCRNSGEASSYGDSVVEAVIGDIIILWSPVENQSSSRTCFDTHGISLHSGCCVESHVVISGL